MAKTTKAENGPRAAGKRRAMLGTSSTSSFSTFRELKLKQVDEDRGDADDATDDDNDDKDDDNDHDDDEDLDGEVDDDEPSVIFSDEDDDDDDASSLSASRESDEDYPSDQAIVDSATQENGGELWDEQQQQPQQKQQKQRQQQQKQQDRQRQVQEARRRPTATPGDNVRPHHGGLPRPHRNRGAASSKVRPGAGRGPFQAARHSNDMPDRQTPADRGAAPAAAGVRKTRPGPPLLRQAHSRSRSNSTRSSSSSSHISKSNNSSIINSGSTVSRDSGASGGGGGGGSGVGSGAVKKPKHKKQIVLPGRHPIRHRHHHMAGGKSSPKLGRFVQLYSKNGYNLKMMANGNVEGTQEVRSDLGESILELDPVALRLYSIKGVKAKRFLCMDAKGRLIGMRRRSEKCLFHVSHRPNGSLTFSTLRTSIKGAPIRWYVAINKHGLAKRGRKETHKGTNFLPRIAHRHQAGLG